MKTREKKMFVFYEVKPEKTGFTYKTDKKRRLKVTIPKGSKMTEKQAADFARKRGKIKDKNKLVIFRKDKYKSYEVY